MIVALAAGLLTFLYTTFFITPQYSSSTMIFVQNYNKKDTSSDSSANKSDADASKNSNSSSNESNNEVAQKIFNSDISGSSTLAKICVTLFQNSDKITALYNGCGVGFSTVDGTFYININVSGSDPEKCANVANQIADMCNVSMDEIKALNPQYRTNVIPGNQKPCILRLSHNAINSFIDAGDSIYAYKADELFTKRNIVEVSNDISSWQNSQPKRGRYVRRHGRRVWVPYKNQPATAASKRKRRGGSGGNTAYHNISGGETLSSIAKKYHTSVKHLQKINGIKGTNIRSGEKIKVK